MRIGFLHPGEMGISLAVSAQNSGQDVCWASRGRSRATQDRAREHGLRDVETLEAMCDTCDVLVSVCPPHAASEVADDVASRGFGGIFVEANAISPGAVKAIEAKMREAGIDFVDGGIIGMPAWKPGATWLYLSGSRAETVASGFHAGPLETEVLGTDIGLASALKMCFAANTKGTTALLTAILGAAENLGVREALEAQWDRYHPDMSRQTHERVRGTARKAWRFTGEMKEIAATLEEAGLPGGFHQGAADIYARQKAFKDAAEPPPLQDILEALLSRRNPE